MKNLCIYILIGTFLALSLGPMPVLADGLALPSVPLDSSATPQNDNNIAIVKGLTIYPENPLQFDFIVEPSVILSEAKDLNKPKDSSSRQNVGTQNDIKSQSLRMIKYFLASLTTPEADMWVNLSPYEKNRIIPESFGQTLMGRDLLAQDYILKQMTASLIHPDSEVGKQFWQKVYSEAQAKYGTTNIPIDTFNKVWIMPDKAAVWEHGNSVFVIERHLKVMLEEDYEALVKNSHPEPKAKDLKVPLDSSALGSRPQNDTSTLGSQIIRDIIIPTLEREVNQGSSFAQLRQIYNAMILATWYKKRLKDSLLGQVYVDQNKVKGVTHDIQLTPEQIYQNYLQTFKKGVFNFIKEEPDPTTGEMIPRKYFSGGMVGLDQAQLVRINAPINRLPLQAQAMLPSDQAMKVSFKTNLAIPAGDETKKRMPLVQGLDEMTINVQGKILTFQYPQDVEGHTLYGIYDQENIVGSIVLNVDNTNEKQPSLVLLDRMLYPQWQRKGIFTTFLKDFVRPRFKRVRLQNVDSILQFVNLLEPVMNRTDILNYLGQKEPFLKGVIDELQKDWVHIKKLSEQESITTETDIKRWFLGRLGGQLVYKRMMKQLIQAYKKHYRQNSQWPTLETLFKQSPPFWKALDEIGFNNINFEFETRKNHLEMDIVADKAMQAASSLQRWEGLKESVLPQQEDEQVKLLQGLSLLSWEDVTTEDMQLLKAFVKEARVHFPQFLTDAIIKGALENSDGVLDLIRRSHPYTLQVLRYPDQFTYHFRLHEGMYYQLFAMKLLGRKSDKPVVVMNVDPHRDHFTGIGDEYIGKHGDGDGDEIKVNGVLDSNWASAALRDGLADAVITARGFLQVQKWFFSILHKGQDGHIISFESNGLPNEFENLVNQLSKDFPNFEMPLTIDLDSFSLQGENQMMTFHLDEDEIKEQMADFVGRFEELGIIPTTLNTADSRGYLAREHDEDWISETREAVDKTVKNVAGIIDIVPEVDVGAEREENERLAHVLHERRYISDLLDELKSLLEAEDYSRLPEMFYNIKEQLSSDGTRDVLEEQILHLNRILVENMLVTDRYAANKHPLSVLIAIAINILDKTNRYKEGMLDDFLSKKLQDVIDQYNSQLERFNDRIFIHDLQFGKLDIPLLFNLDLIFFTRYSKRYIPLAKATTRIIADDVADHIQDDIVAESLFLMGIHLSNDEIDNVDAMDFEILEPEIAYALRRIYEESDSIKIDRLKTALSKLLFAGPQLRSKVQTSRVGSDIQKILQRISLLLAEFGFDKIEVMLAQQQQKDHEALYPLIGHWEATLNNWLFFIAHPTKTATDVLLDYWNLANQKFLISIKMLAGRVFDKSLMLMEVTPELKAIRNSKVDDLYSQVIKSWQDMAMQTVMATDQKEKLANLLESNFVLDREKVTALVHRLRKQTLMREITTDGYDLFKDAEGRKVVELGPAGTTRFFDAQQRWILTIDPFGNKTDELLWDDNGAFKELWTRNINGFALRMDDRYVEGSSDVYFEDDEYAKGRLNMFGHKIGEGKIDDMPDSPILSFYSPPSFLEEAKFIPESGDPGASSRRAKGTGVTMLGILSNLARDKGHSLRYSGRNARAVLFYTLKEIARNNVNTYLQFHKNLEVEWIPDPPERIFNPDGVYLLVRNKVVQRVKYRGVTFFNTKALLVDPYIIPTAIIMQKQNEDYFELKIGDKKVLVINHQGDILEKPQLDDDLESYSFPAGHNQFYWQDSKDAAMQASTDGALAQALRVVEIWRQKRHVSQFAFAERVALSPGARVTMVGTSTAPETGIAFALKGAQVLSVSLGFEYGHVEKDAYDLVKSAIEANGGKYEIRTGTDYLKVDNGDSTQDMLMMFNVLDDPDTQQKEELILKALRDLKEGGLFLGSHLVGDRKWNDLITRTASEYGFELHPIDDSPPSISGGTPFAFRVVKKPREKSDAMTESIRQKIENYVFDENLSERVSPSWWQVYGVKGHPEMPVIKIPIGMFRNHNDVIQALKEYALRASRFYGGLVAPFVVLHDVTIKIREAGSIKHIRCPVAIVQQRLNIQKFAQGADDLIEQLKERGIKYMDRITFNTGLTAEGKLLLADIGSPTFITQNMKEFPVPPPEVPDMAMRDEAMPTSEGSNEASDDEQTRKQVSETLSMLQERAKDIREIIKEKNFEKSYRQVDEWLQRNRKKTDAVLSQQPDEIRALERITSILCAKFTPIFRARRMYQTNAQMVLFENGKWIVQNSSSTITYDIYDKLSKMALPADALQFILKSFKESSRDNRAVIVKIVKLMNDRLKENLPYYVQMLDDIIDPLSMDRSPNKRKGFESLSRPQHIYENFLIPAANLLYPERRDDNAIMTENLGGIDMNASHLDLTIKRDSTGMPLPATQQDWAQVSILGLEPEIIKIESFDSKSLFSYN